MHVVFEMQTGLSSVTCVSDVYFACRDEADSSAAHTAPVRSACLPVAVEFTRLETEHLPARETREQEISSYKRKAQVHQNVMVFMIS